MQKTQKKGNKRTPAKKKNNSSATNQSNRILLELREGWKQGTISFVIGVAGLFFTIFTLIACISYLFTAAHDQSVVESASFSRSLFQDGDVNNLLGILGATLGHRLINNFLGIGIFLFFPFLFLLFFRLMGLKRRFHVFKILRFFVVSSLMAIWVSLLSSLVSVPMSEYLPFRLGGIHGDVLRDFLKVNISYVGTILLLFFSLVIIIVLFRPQSKHDIRKALAADGVKLKKRTKTASTVSAGNQEDPADRSTSLPSEEEVGNEASEIALASQTSDNNEEDLISNHRPPSHIEQDYSSDRRLKIEVAKGNDDDALVKEVTERAHLDAKGNVNYLFPTLDLLADENINQQLPDMEEIRYNEQLIIDTLESFHIKVIPIKATVGPTVTLYEIEPEAGIKIARIRGLEDDIALGLKAEGIRIIAPMPGKGTIGIEVPNKKPQSVGIKGLLGSRKYTEHKMHLPIAMGRSITNEVFMFDLAKMPHLLIAGATGQGKSVGINVIITSLLYAKHPSELKFVMVDPKILEFSIYEPLEDYFFAKMPGEKSGIITNTERVLPTLLSLCEEMDNRYELLSRAKVRNISDYNDAFKQGLLDESEGHALLPYIVLVIDEFADLISTGGKEVEKPIARLAQKARAAGIHMILATQRPTTDVVTGTIKSNFPARIAFKVFSGIDSKTILDAIGANRLIGRGDMLFFQGKDMIRLQCGFIDTPETKRIVDFISEQPYRDGIYELPLVVTDDGNTSEALSKDKLDPLFEEVARSIVASQQGSTSKIQREFEVGFNRAGRIMDQLQSANIVGKQQGSKPREVLVHDLEALNTLLYKMRNEL